MKTTTSMVAVFVFCAVYCTSAFAGSETVGITAVGTGRPIRYDETKTAMIRKADFAFAILEIVSERASDKDYFEDILSGVQEVERRAKAETNITVIIMPPSGENSSYRGKASILSSGAGLDTATKGVLTVSTKIDDSDDLYKATSRIIRFVQGLRPPGKTSIKLSGVGLGVNEPDQYKDALLKLVKDRVEIVRKLLGDSIVVDIPNIQSPITIEAINARDVRMFVGYSLAYHEPKQPGTVKTQQ